MAVFGQASVRTGGVSLEHFVPFEHCGFQPPPPPFFSFHILNGYLCQKCHWILGCWHRVFSIVSVVETVDELLEPPRVILLPPPPSLCKLNYQGPEAPKSAMQQAAAAAVGWQPLKKNRCSTRMPRLVALNKAGSTAI